ncbi:MAG: hypothetical protein DME26_18550 [Verrucomicrobia bacterium]|nr:MAG: hypothetical protein DME26_18550 [Verrucomicrobiota bacterium]
MRKDMAPKAAARQGFCTHSYESTARKVSAWRSRKRRGADFSPLHVAIRTHVEEQSGVDGRTLKRNEFRAPKICAAYAFRDGREDGSSEPPPDKIVRQE